MQSEFFILAEKLISDLDQMTSFLKSIHIPLSMKTCTKGFGAIGGELSLFTDVAAEILEIVSIIS